MKSLFYINGHIVRPELHQIQINGKSLKVEPKVMEVLLYLTRYRDRVVSKAELLEAIWGDTIVIEKVLTRSISELRKAFDDNARQPHIIETVPKSGYRLIAKVEFPKKRSPTKTFVSMAVLGLFGASLLGMLVLWLYRPVENFPLPAFQANPISSFHSWEYDPSISPDGQRIAFVWNGMDKPDWNFRTDNSKSWGIYIKDLEKDTLLTFINEPGSEGSPRWSSDGQHLLYYRQKGDTASLFIKALNPNSQERKLASFLAKYPDLSWSKDGKWVAYQARDTTSMTYRIYLLSLITLEQQQLTEPPEAIWGDFQASFSPDGRLLAFTRAFSEGVQDVFLYDLLTKKESRLTERGANVLGHDWMSDNNGLLLALNSNGHSELWQMDVRTKSLDRLPSGLGYANPDWHPNGIVLEQWTSETNIWALSLSEDTSPAATKSVIHSTAWDLHPGFSPDGQQIAFASNRSGHYEIWAADKEGQQAKKLTDLRQGFCGNPKWSPNGNQIVFDARPGGQSDLYLLDLGDHKVQQLTSNTHEDINGFFSEDGQHLFFFSNRNGKWQLWKYAIEKKETSLAYPNEMISMQSLHSGSFYFTHPEKDGIWYQKEGASSPRLIIPELESTDWGNWTLSQKGIYFIQRQDYPASSFIAFYNFETQKSQPVHVLPNNIPRRDRSLALSPDGKVLLFGQVDRSACDLWLLNVPDH